MKHKLKNNLEERDYNMVNRKRIDMDAFEKFERAIYNYDQICGLVNVFSYGTIDNSDCDSITAGINAIEEALRDNLMMLKEVYDSLANAKKDKTELL